MKSLLTVRILCVVLLGLAIAATLGGAIPHGLDAHIAVWVMSSAQSPIEPIRSLGFVAVT